MNVFVGYDASTIEAYLACLGSIRENTRSVDTIEVTPINHRTVRKQGLFYRAWEIDETGQYWDREDGKPFSTEFSHSRFLTVPLAKRMGLDGWVMFCDSDFIFLQDLSKLFNYCKDYPDKALMTVQFDWQPDDQTKMAGQIQARYHRKLWSSLMMFNLDHPSNSRLTTEKVNKADGGDLHAFDWLTDDELGELPAQWNWVPGVSADNIVPSGIHFSGGIPTHPGQENAPYSDEWWGYLFRQYKHLGKSAKRNPIYE